MARRSSFTAAAVSARRWPQTTCRRWATPTSSRWTAGCEPSARPNTRLKVATATIKRGNPERVPTPSRDGLPSAKPSSVHATILRGNPERVPTPSRDGLPSAKPSSVHAIADLRSPSLVAVRRAIVDCEDCPRLRRYCENVAREKKAAHRDDVYWGRPVAGFGDPEARLLLVGLAPAAHGANRTGRVFTGDGSGDFLFGALHGTGFASIPTSRRADDGLTLTDAYILAAVRCAP